MDQGANLKPDLDPHQLNWMFLDGLGDRLQIYSCNRQNQGRDRPLNSVFGYPINSDVAETCHLSRC